MNSILARLIGDRIAAQRLARKMTQQEMADQMGVSRSYVSRVEVGLVGFSVDSLYTLAGVLRCEVFELLPSRRQVNNGAGGR